MDTYRISAPLGGTATVLHHMAQLKGTMQALATDTTAAASSHNRRVKHTGMMSPEARCVRDQHGSPHLAYCRSDRRDRALLRSNRPRLNLEIAGHYTSVSPPGAAANVCMALPVSVQLLYLLSRAKSWPTKKVDFVRPSLLRRDMSKIPAFYGSHILYSTVLN
eukprot:6195456-Pleurochrysis_carterae.AAC.2